MTFELSQHQLLRLPFH